MKTMYDLDLIVGGENDENAVTAIAISAPEMHIMPIAPELKKPIGLPKPRGLDDDLDVDMAPAEGIEITIALV